MNRYLCDEGRLVIYAASKSKALDTAKKYGYAPKSLKRDGAWNPVTAVVEGSKQVDEPIIDRQYDKPTKKAG